MITCCTETKEIDAFLNWGYVCATLIQLASVVVDGPRDAKHSKNYNANVVLLIHVPKEIINYILTCIQTAVEFNTAVFWTPTDTDTSFDNNDSLHSFSVKVPKSKLKMVCRHVSVLCLVRNKKMISRTCSSWIAFSFYSHKTKGKMLHVTMMHCITHKVCPQFSPAGSCRGILESFSNKPFTQTQTNFKSQCCLIVHLPVTDVRGQGTQLEQ